MNQDIIYEILRYLYLIGEARNAKKTILSLKKLHDIESRKIEKPIVLSILCKSIELKIIAQTTFVIYWGDNKNTHTAPGNISFPIHEYNNKSRYTIIIFGQCEFLVPAPEVKVISIGELTNLSHMYKSFSGNINIGKKWDTSKVTQMYEMFKGCKKLNKNIGKYWDTSNVKNMEAMFYGCKELNQKLGRYWNTSKVTNMSWMFYKCEKLEELEVKNWKISQVTNMQCMFAYCNELSRINCQEWILNKIANTNYIFYGTKVDKNLLRKLIRL
jgi:surface protein